MTHEEWVAQVKVATRSRVESPEKAAEDLVALADAAEKLIPSCVSEWHVSQALSMAATILEETDLERALPIVSRQADLLGQRIRGVADHLCSAAAHETLLLAQLGRLSDARNSLAEALRVSALAPMPNMPLELALAAVRKLETQPNQP